jgi:hypothetical protein
VLIAEYPWRNAGNVWYSNPDAKPLISRLDIYSGKKQQLDMAPLARAQLLLDFDDNVRLAYGENEFHKPSVSWKPEPGSAWTSFALEGFRDETVIPGRFSTDNRSVFLTGAREGEAFDALYRLDLQTRALEKVHAFEDASVDELITDFADREIVGVSSYTARRNDYWLAKDNPTAQTYQALQRAFPQQRIRVTSNSDDGRLVIVLVDSDVNPGDYYLFDTVTNHADFLRAGRIWIEPKQMRRKSRSHCRPATVCNSRAMSRARLVTGRIRWWCCLTADRSASAIGGSSIRRCSCSRVAVTPCCRSTIAAAVTSAWTSCRPATASGAARCRTISPMRRAGRSSRRSPRPIGSASTERAMADTLR